MMTGMGIYLGLSIALNSCMPGTPPIAASTGMQSSLTSFAKELASLPLQERDVLVKKFVKEYTQTPVIDSDTVFGLYWYGKAKEVLITGDLQSAWSAPENMKFVNCGDSSFYYISYTVPADARLDYQFIIDSVYMTDPRNPVITPSGFGPHSQVAMPGFHSDPDLNFNAAIQHGRIDSMYFKSRDTSILSRPLKVYLPPGYDSLSDLPVLYVMDGLEALVYMAYPNVLDNLIAANKIEPVIVVFVPPVDRGGEYLGKKDGIFLDGLCRDIVPMIDSTYKTSKLAGKRGITGISAGGHFALLALFSRSDVFGCGAGQSPTITSEISRALKKLIGKGTDLPSLRIYFDVGRYDLGQGYLDTRTFLEANSDFHIELEKQNIPHQFNIVDDGHEWANWRERTGEILEYFFGKKR